MQQKLIKALLRKLGNSYYLVGYQDMFETNPSKVLTYLDLNAGPKNKDNKRAAIYSSKGTFVTDITGAALIALRASLGIRVDGNGKQTRDVPVFQGTIPADARSLIMLNSAQLYKRIEAAIPQLSDTATAGAARGQLQLLSQLYRSALVVEKQMSASGHIVYSTFLRNYLVNPKDNLENRLIDLAFGYEYDLNGKPFIERSPIYMQEDGKGMLAIGSNSANAPVVFFSADSSTMYRMEGYDQIQGTFEGGQTGERTDFFNAHVGTLVTYYNHTSDTYTVFLLKNESAGQSNKPQKIGVFKKSALYHAMVQRVTLSQEDMPSELSTEAGPQAPIQLLVLWDGSADFNVQKILYNDQMHSIGSQKSSNGKDSFSAIVKTVAYGSSVTGNYIEVRINGNINYYVPMYSMLEPSVSADCTTEKNVQHLDYWKRCRWQLNTVADSYGKQRIVPVLNTTALKTISSTQRASLLKTVPEDRKPFVEKALKKLLYDTEHKRFLYSVSPDDQTKDFWQDDIFDGSYIDIYDGIIYTPFVQQ